MFCKKSGSILHILEKIFLAVITIPPFYVGMRYLRWYFRQKKATEGTDD